MDDDLPLVGELPGPREAPPEGEIRRTREDARRLIGVLLYVLFALTLVLLPMGVMAIAAVGWSYDAAKPEDIPHAL